ncbi:hypothetical protein QBC34DRAFT_422242 [Podospora aff. communis PSN243]|uniref:CBF1-interacting co-repressor CIR N-terminal domain-containing protein n=1 Tax=Podospora aff. communis PSN243 TaxID=3040156 RepID=A0AAV9GZ34_9PEZI|nr:hypothetical protein QBC34DRAFT_422242 [Podospora aff. communis PSN243]
MPLPRLNLRSHLLGKKSWNVYNADNIARVERDEAAARAREEADEQRMQEEDAARRLAILRGETPPPLEERLQKSDDEQADRGSARHYAPSREGGPRKRKRKRHGEDDTDFEMRVAREQAEAGGHASRELLPGASSSVSLVDGKGHISLFNEDEARRGQEKEDAERDAAKKKRKEEEQHQVRLADAAGRGASKTGPWYATPDGDASGALVPSKDVFGNDDPRRKVREAARLDANDPLAMMKRGAAKVRELGKDRKREAEEREKELKSLRKEQRRRDKERRRRDEHSDRHKDGERDSRPTRGERSRQEGDRYEESRRRDDGRHRDRDEKGHRDKDAFHRVLKTLFPPSSQLRNHHVPFHGKLIATGNISLSTSSATGLASKAFKATNISSTNPSDGPSFLSLRISNPSFVNVVAANHETIHRSVVPSAPVLSPHPSNSQWLLSSANQRLPRHVQMLPSPAISAVSMPETLFTPPLPPRDSYSTLSSMRSRGGLEVSGSRGL